MEYRSGGISVIVLLLLLLAYWTTFGARPGDVKGIWYGQVNVTRSDKVQNDTRSDKVQNDTRSDKVQRVVCTEGKEVCQHGEIVPGRKYAVFTSSLFDGIKSMNYGFGLPLSVLAWRRIGYDSIVMIIGDSQPCGNNTKAHMLVETLTNMDNVVVLILKGMPQRQSVTVSQVSRLFTASLIQDGGDTVRWQDTYVITADADIWPLGAGLFDLPDGKAILHGDIGMISTGGLSVIHAPLSYVGMKIKTWRAVLSKGGNLTLPRTPEQVITYLQPVFGRACCNNIHHGGPGWGMDQRLISLRIHQWKMINNKSDKIYVYKRKFLDDRFDRIRWKLGSLKGIVDSHILQYSYKPAVWTTLRPLLELMFSDNVTLSWCDQYSNAFNNKTDVC